jgi:hypothetical protein
LLVETKYFAFFFERNRRGTLLLEFIRREKVAIQKRKRTKLKTKKSN